MQPVWRGTLGRSRKRWRRKISQRRGFQVVRFKIRGLLFWWVSSLQYSSLLVWRPFALFLGLGVKGSAPNVFPHVAVPSFVE